eukprot:763243-Hanusia_phi.AAC.1
MAWGGDGGMQVAASKDGSGQGRVRRASHLEEKCLVSGLAASFARWEPKFGWNMGTNAKLQVRQLACLPCARLACLPCARRRVLHSIGVAVCSVAPKVTACVAVREVEKE